MRYPKLLPLISTLILLAIPAFGERAKVVTYAKTYGSYRAPEATRESGAVVETFYLAEGQLEGTDMESVPFSELGSEISLNLTQRGFTPSASEQDADLVIIVHRGRTDPFAPQDASAEGSQPGDSGMASAPNFANGSNPMSDGSSRYVPSSTSGLRRPGNLGQLARKLGYFERLQELEGARNHPMSSDRLDEVLAELSQERYYIVLAAYDAHELRRRGRQVLLWETRLSFNAEGKAFADRYPAMLTAAARHFGQNTPASLTRRFVALD